MMISSASSPVTFGARKGHFGKKIDIEPVGTPQYIAETRLRIRQQEPAVLTKVFHDAMGEKITGFDVMWAANTAGRKKLLKHPIFWVLSPVFVPMAALEKVGKKLVIWGDPSTAHDVIRMLSLKYPNRSEHEMTLLRKNIDSALSELKGAGLLTFKDLGSSYGYILSESGREAVIRHRKLVKQGGEEAPAKALEAMTENTLENASLDVDASPQMLEGLSEKIARACLALESAQSACQQSIAKNETLYSVRLMELTESKQKLSDKETALKVWLEKHEKNRQPDPVERTGRELEITLLRQENDKEEYLVGVLYKTDRMQKGQKQQLSLGIREISSRLRQSLTEVEIAKASEQLEALSTKLTGGVHVPGIDPQSRLRSIAIACRLLERGVENLKHHHAEKHAQLLLKTIALANAQLGDDSFVSTLNPLAQESETSKAIREKLEKTRETLEAQRTPVSSGSGPWDRD